MTTILPGVKRDASCKSPRRSGGKNHMKDHARARTNHHGQRRTADRKLRKIGYGTLQRKALVAIVRHHERRGARGTHRHRAKIKCVRRSRNARARNRREKNRTTNGNSPKKTHQARLVHGTCFLRRFLRSAVGAERGGRLRAGRVFIHLTRCRDLSLLVIRTDSGQVRALHARAFATCPAPGKELEL